MAAWEYRSLLLPRLTNSRRVISGARNTRNVPGGRECFRLLDQDCDDRGGAPRPDTRANGLRRAAVRARPHPAARAADADRTEFRPGLLAGPTVRHLRR